MKKSNYEQHVRISYSTAFKLKVVEDIESGKFSMTEAGNIYDIGGVHTISRWMVKSGKSQLLSKVLRVEMKDEKDKLIELQGRVLKLEKLLADNELDNLMNAAFLEILAEYNGNKNLQYV